MSAIPIGNIRLIPPDEVSEEERGYSSTGSTESTGTAWDDEGVEGVEGPTKKPEYDWRMEAGLDKNFWGVGVLLASMRRRLSLFRLDDGGLLAVDDGKVRRIATAKELAPLLIDHIRIHVTKKGKYHGEKVTDSTLANMLHSEEFLKSFRLVDEVVTTPVVLADYRQSRPGHNPQGNILFVGSPIPPASATPTINKFLGVMEWASNADRTNAVAGALTVLFRHHFPGGKPLILISATKSHAGKGTVVEFMRGGAAKAEILYEGIDWPMEKSVNKQLLSRPETGVINIDNVRLDSSGRGKLIRSGFLESFVTTAEIHLSSPGLRPIRTTNKFAVLLNTNEGSLSADLLNRALPIRIAPTGDVTQRRSQIGNPKLEFLPANRGQIDSELWGMVERWRREGCPQDTSVAGYPMGPWAKLIGGILKVNGFADFLANYQTTRVSADPIREALGVLAFNAGGVPRRAGELAKVVISQGLAKVLLPGIEVANAAACERTMGVVLRPYVGETFTARTASEEITYSLKKESRRWEGDKPHFRYTFQEVGRAPVSSENTEGLVLE